MTEGNRTAETGEKKKAIRWFVSLMEERAWLEEMSLQGWFLTDLRVGIWYVFEKGEPKRTAYDVERFDLEKNPTRREIQEKSALMDMALETGWRQVCRDEAMNYYLAKDWEDEETNELYDSPEDRARRVERYSRLFSDKIHLILWVCVLMQGLALLFWFLPAEEGVGWFSAFDMIYTFCCLLFCLTLLRWRERYSRELKLSMEEWKAIYGKKDTITKFRLVLTVGGLTRYLERQSAAGYHLKNMRVFRFVFTPGEAEEISYMMDTKYLTNRRRKKSGGNVFKDGWDWEGRNNDWQVQSLKEAEAAGWEFAGAVECRNILYRAEKGKAVPINDAGGFRVTSAVGGRTVYIVTAGLIGGIIGGLIGYFFL
ncbi:MAG: DUF2812 domain-containing protein [Lachnospiraceae bacterium]|jgi:hypothetical protein|nr:DUF2812 domain-containing protein [Lachnospiraceae bacterium]